MAQTERSPIVNTFPPMDLTALRANIQPGNTINLTDINSLGTLIKNWLGHFHTYDDVSQAATYGNSGDRNYYATTTASAPYLSITVGMLDDIEAGAEITAAKHNEFRGYTAQLASHAHSIDDVGG